MKQDKIQPHLFYYTMDFETGKQHYFFAKNELRALLEQYFKIIEIKNIHRDKGQTKYYLTICQKPKNI